MKGFRKIELASGESRRVEFTVGAEELQYIGQDYKPVVEPGEFVIHVGSHVNETLSAKLIVREG
ncbi:hypothetical protein D3C76_1767710 [compost metagenome]